MSKVEEIWEQIQNLTLQEKIIIYKRIKQEVYNKPISFQCREEDDKEDNIRY